MKKYSLSQILGIINHGFNQIFGDFEFWFETEIGRIKVVNGIVYLDLIQYSEDGKIIAKARGCIYNLIIWNNFLKDVGISIEETKGIKILFHGSLNFHYEFGFSISIDSISSEYVIGLLKKNQLKIRDLLISQGLYNKNKNTINGYPDYNIAVISSKTSEGLKDFNTTLQKSGFKFDIVLYESCIHGNEAKIGVYTQLQNIYLDIKKGKKIDFVAIIRGGGGSDGIIWQNDLNIAKGVCYMPVPVIIAVGHTSDIYILDEICKFSAQTPTQAAYLLIQIVSQYLEQCEFYKNNINTICLQKIVLIKNNIENIYSQIKLNSNNIFKSIQNNIELIYKNICSFSPRKIITHGYGILYNMNNELLNKYQIEELKPGEKLIIHIYNKKIYINIQDII